MQQFKQEVRGKLGKLAGLVLSIMFILALVPATASATYTLGNTTGGGTSDTSTGNSRGTEVTTPTRSFMQVVAVGTQGVNAGNFRMALYDGTAQGSNLLVDFGQMNYTSGGGAWQEIAVPVKTALASNSTLAIVWKNGTTSPSSNYYQNSGATNGIRAFDGSDSNVAFPDPMPTRSTTNRYYAYYIVYDVLPTLGSISDNTLDDAQTGVVITGGGFENQNEFGAGTSHVYLAAGSTWAAHGTMQEQTATAWPNDGGGSSETITFTVAQGSLSAGTVYLYVMNSDGEVNANGYALTMNSSTVNGLTVGTSSAVVDNGTQITVSATFTGDDNANSSTQVEYNTSNSWPGTVKCASITGASPRVCVVDGLAPGTQYWFRVTHTDADGVTGTNPQVIGPYATPDNPLTVGTSSAVVDSSTQITVSTTFTGDDNANSSTQVEYNTSNSWPGTVKCASITGASPRVCVVNGLAAGTQYWFRVTHSDADGVNGTNPQVIGPYSTPDNPLTAGTSSAVVDSGTQITVSATFTGDQNANSSTQIEYNTSNSWPGTVKCASITGASPRVCVVDGLLPATQYWFRITHTDADGVIGTNPQVIGPYATADNSITLGTATANVDSATQITVTANFTGDQNGNSSTQVEYNISNSWPGTVKCAAVTGSSPRTCVVNGLASNTQYWFRITYTDADGVSGTNPQVIGPYTTPDVQKLTCGMCHGGVSKTPAYEALALPLEPDVCGETGRGLHGTHNNYSSATFKMNADGTRGNCAYCHTATTSTAPTETHNNNYVNITGNVVTGRQAMDTTGLDYNSGTSTCTNACHKNRGTTAVWGNYTATTPFVIALTCRSCHDDVTDKASTSLSGAHGAHLNTAINTGGTAMGAAGDAGCVNCHPDNRNDLWSQGKKDDGSVKAYPHASDGTHVVFDNASVISSISATRVAGSGDTCANACHNNTATARWDDTALGCDACHYYGGPDMNDPPTFAGNSTAAVRLQGKHGAHIAAGKTCSDCHIVPSTNGDTTHVTALPVTPGNATITRTGMTFDRATDPANPTCTFGSGGAGNGCHGDNMSTPSWYYAGTFDCGSCHEYPGTANDWTGNNGHLVRYDPPIADTHMRATGYNAATDDYATVTADNTRCGFCHSGGTHVNGTVDVSSAGKGYNYCAPGDFTINVNATGSNVTCSNVFCHSGNTTPNWY